MSTSSTTRVLVYVSTRVYPHSLAQVVETVLIHLLMCALPHIRVYMYTLKSE